MLLGTINISVSGRGRRAGGEEFQLFVLLLWIFVSGFSLLFVKINTCISIKFI